jgi:hypothetical protein
MKAKYLIHLISALVLIPTGFVRAENSFQDYKDRFLSQKQSELREKRFARRFFPDKKPVTETIEFSPSFPQSLAPLPDFKVNQEPGTATYEQTNPRLTIFPSGSFLAVWEESRNGDFDIFGQKYDSSGMAVGTNFQINLDLGFSDQLLPDVAIDQNGNLVVVWVENDSLQIFAQRYDSTLSALGSSFKVNSGPANTAWKPAVAAAPSGAFAVVWEDIRSGYNIYGQFYDSLGNAVGSNFKINSGSGFFPRLAPRAEYDGTGNLVVVWEDYQDGDGDIYFQRYDSSRNPVDTNILITADLAAEDQYLPEVDRLFDGRFAITYVETRASNPDIFLQRFSNNGTQQDTAVKVNSDAGSDDQWDPAVSSDSASRISVCWADYRSTPAIYLQSYDTLSSPQGSNTQISSLGALREKNSPALDRNRKGKAVIVWQDQRAGNFDIFGQRISATDGLAGINFKINSDNLGAFQRNPAITTLANGTFSVAWEDYRAGNADIYFRTFDRFGSPLNSDTKVNSDTSLSDQTFPDICSDMSGNLLVTWLDEGSGSRIMGQFYSPGLSPLGANIEISDDTGSTVHTRPTCAATMDGKYMAVWTDNRNLPGTQQIFGQIFSSPATLLGSNFQVNDDTSSFDHLSPRIGADSTGHFAVVWSDTRTGISRVYLRSFDGSGTPQHPSLQVVSDSSGTAQYLPDIAVTPFRSRVVAWLEDRAAGTNVFTQRYDSLGVPLGPNIAIADPSLGLPNNPRIVMDINETFFVTWEDNRTGDPDVFGQFYYASNDSAGEDIKINSDAGTNLQISPDAALSRSEAYICWTDNRTAGSGLDIYAKLVSYLGVNVRRPPVKISNLPRDFTLHRNFPNPFNASTQIIFEIKPTSLGAKEKASLRIYNVRGELVAILVEGLDLAGVYQVVWDGKDNRGEQVASGVYFYRLEMGGRAETRKMTLLK